MVRTCLIFLLLLALVGLAGAVTVLAEEPIIQQSTVWVNADQLHLRSNPDVASPSLGLLKQGEELTLVQLGADWSKVKSGRLGEGWVASQFLSTKRVGEVSRSSRGRVDELLAQAKHWLGVHYVYGGSSPAGFDCSGFTMTVYRTQGMMLPHSALAQSRVGTPVAKSNLQPGDLVFFMTCGKTVINHVGIYIGDGMFIHASSGRGYVTINSLNEGYYLQRYVGAVRLLDSSSSEIPADVPDMVVHSLLDERTSG